MGPHLLHKTDLRKGA